jgi:hypothetical protein
MTVQVAECVQVAYPHEHMDDLDSVNDYDFAIV